MPAPPQACPREYVAMGYVPLGSSLAMDVRHMAMKSLTTSPMPPLCVAFSAPRVRRTARQGDSTGRG